MKKNFFKKISVIIPVRPGGEIKTAIEALEKVNYPAELVEVFVSYGFSPSRQRNLAVKKAKGEIVYFLDDDSEVESYAFRRAVATFSGEAVLTEVPPSRGFSFFPHWVNRLIANNFFSGIIYKGEIGAVGGPNVWWEKETFDSSIAGIILESFFVHFQMAARYRPIGLVHKASEKELISCNLAVRRDIFEKIHGFNENLFPNEENELLNRVEKAGYQLVYHPGILVFRPRRQTFRTLWHAFFHYGRGRMEQIRIEGLESSFIFLTPLLFLFYLLGLIFSCVATSFVSRFWFVFLPLILYFILGFFSALGFSLRRKKIYLALFLPFFFLLCHLVYAWGLMVGSSINLEKRKRERMNKIEIVKIKSFDKRW